MIKKGKGIKLSAIGLVAFCALTGICGCSNAAGEKASAGKSEEAVTAVDFTLKDLQGNEVSLSSFRGKKVLLVFGASWCPYCVKEVPQLNNLYNKYKDKELKILYIDIQEGSARVWNFVKKYKIKYTTLLDRDRKVAAQYKVHGIPTNILLDKEGVIEYTGRSIPDGL